MALAMGSGWLFSSTTGGGGVGGPTDISSLAMAIFFGGIGMAWGLIAGMEQVTALFGKDVVARCVGTAKLEQPHGVVFAPQAYLVLRYFTEVGVILGLCYLCENNPPYPHSAKFYSRDLYFVLCFLLIGVSAFTLKKSSGQAGDVLNREQTEEWKGWMQFMFLIYHYYHATEMYNSIRVFITCYVWMTGFGNFSFFYIKQDFGLVRMIQMLWRLNFLVVFLCWTMNVPYILYYICPLHTVFYMMVYVVMGILPRLNHDRWGIRVKLLVCGACLFLVYDSAIPGISDLFFGYLSTQPGIGATSGTRWEWYFRTALDHWSALLGMAFAHNFPLMTLWLKKVEEMPPNKEWAVKCSAGAVLLGVLYWWVTRIFLLKKSEYNAVHPYLGFVPMIVYIYFRNIHMALRTHHLEALHKVGQITLETYLLQHHIWLTSNAKSLLTLIPGYPLGNALLVTSIYVFCAFRLQRLTIALRTIVLPNNLNMCLWNLFILGGLLCGCFALAAVLKFLELGFGVAFVVIVGVGAFAAFLFLTCLYRKGEMWLLSQPGGLLGVVSSPHAPVRTRQLQLLLSVFLLFSFISVLCSSSEDTVLDVEGMRGKLARRQQATTSGGTDNEFPTPWAGGMGAFGYTNKELCKTWAQQGGSWLPSEVCRGGAGTNEIFAETCKKKVWGWRNPPFQCNLHFLEAAEVSKLLQGRRVVFAGDSVLRNVFYATRVILGEELVWELARNRSVPRHADIWVDDPSTPSAANNTKNSADHHHGGGGPPTMSSSLPKCGGCQLKFLWRPFVANLTTELKRMRSSSSSNSGAGDVLVLGGGLWDALHRPRHNYEVASATFRSGHGASADDTALMGFDADVNELAQMLQEAREGPGPSSLADLTVVLATAPTVVDKQLNTPAKRLHMTEARVASYRRVVRNALFPLVDAVLDTRRVTEGARDRSIDGVHYPQEVDTVLAQLLGNTLRTISADKKAGGGQKKKAQPQAGSLASFWMGAFVIAILAWTLLTVDNFFGVSLLAYEVVRLSPWGSQCGNKPPPLRWDDAFGPIIAKSKNPSGIPQ